MKRLLMLIGTALCFLTNHSIAAEPKDVGVVLLHGWGLLKNPPPGHIDPHRRNQPLANALKDEGFLVIQQELPWGPNRIIDASFDDAMLEIDAQVEKLKAQGAKKIVIAGHSMGTPMALGYAARRNTVNGVIGLAPGHHPELMPLMYPDFYPKQIAKAKEAVAAGQGDQKTTFEAAQCCTFYQSFWTTPRIYLSYFDPDGPGTMAGNVKMIKRSIPVLMIYGNKDVIFELVSRANESYSEYVLTRVQPNPMNKRIIIDSDHAQVPALATQEVIAWLKSLP